MTAPDAHTSYVLVVDWKMAVANAYIEPTFDPSHSDYNIFSPCDSFSVSAVVNQATCLNCSVSIDGTQDSASFDTLSTSSINVTICQDCLNGPTLTTNLDVAVCKYKPLSSAQVSSFILPYISLLILLIFSADQLYLEDVTAYPGGANLNFENTTFSYLIGTGQEYITISTAVSPGAQTSINGVVTNMANISLVSDANNAISVVLESTDFSCTAASVHGASYNFNVAQGWTHVAV